MKKLLLVLTLLSCGYIKVPLFEQHMDDEHKESKKQEVMIHASKPLLCSKEAFNYKCTNLVIDRVLNANEFFSIACHQSYTACLYRSY